MNKTQELEKVNQEILHCPFCLSHTTGKLVVGEGSANAAIAFIGEAPGKTESKTGRPFVGRSGKFLRKLIAGIGIQENGIKYFITLHPAAALHFLLLRRLLEEDFQKLKKLIKK